jgi:hypothetical protein
MERRNPQTHWLTRNLPSATGKQGEGRLHLFGW